MTEREREDLAFAIFNFATRVMNDLADRGKLQSRDEPWQTVREIAGGTLTLSNPGDMARRFPEVADYIASQAGRLIRRDREFSELVLAGFENILPGPELDPSSP